MTLKKNNVATTAVLALLGGIIVISYHNHFVPYADRYIITISYHMQIETLYGHFVPYADDTLHNLQHDEGGNYMAEAEAHMTISNHIKKYIMTISYHMQIDTL